MSDLTEKEFQNWLAGRIADLGWELTLDDDDLGRAWEEVVRWDELESALIRLNPEIAEEPERTQQVISAVRAVLLSSANDGLVAANREFAAWIAGRRTIKYVGEDQHSQVRLIDFDQPRSNILRVTTEAWHDPSGQPEPPSKDLKSRRYDIVLWVNGIPVVVGETKAPKDNTTWLDGAIDIHNGYEVKTRMFFVPNVLSFASDSREFRYGAVRQPPESWLNWAKTTDEIMEPGLPAVARSTELLLTPEMVFDILRFYTLYTSRRTREGAVDQKIIPRYPQVEAVDAIVERCLDPTKQQGLVWHHQGSGKTFAMAYAASRLRHITAMDAPTTVVVLDRLDLIEQTTGEFQAVGISGLQVAETKEHLRELLSQDSRGVIITTIFRFKDAGPLNDRSNIVVMVDEAHRTQEGRLGLDMREALPNAKFIGLTGTPVSTSDRNTWAMFGDPDDKNQALNHYSVERSIYDGATLPVTVETRLVDYHLDRDALQAEFDELAAEENLDEDQQKFLTKKASHLSSVVSDQDRINAVCADIVTHYRERMAPLGLKAQIVAYDRATCVAYQEAITTLLVPGEESTIVMTTSKTDPDEWAQWDLSRDEEASVKDRFRDLDDPLKFLIVTAKLLTGFDAPIEGVMYLGKPLRAHTLFQATCRTNRRWTHPRTGQEKMHGLIVDYVGMGPEIAKAVTAKPADGQPTSDGDIDTLLAEFEAALHTVGGRLGERDDTQPDLDQVLAAVAAMPDRAARDLFAAEFLKCQGLFEFLWPSHELRPFEDAYRFAAKVYANIARSNAENHALWHRLGAKTIAIVHRHLDHVTIGSKPFDQVALDGATLEYLRDNQLVLIPDDSSPKRPPSADDVLDRLEERIRRKLGGSRPHRHWRSLSERLEDLRQSKVETAEQSVEFLKKLMELASDLVRVEKAEAEDRIDEERVLDPRKGALTEIFQAYSPADSPEVVERVVDEVDELVLPVRGTGWQTSHPGDRKIRMDLRKVLDANGLPPVGELFDRAYAYVKSNY